MNEHLQNALLASSFGMIGGGFLKTIAAWWRRKRLRDKLTLYTTPPHQNLVPIRVHNYYVHPLTKCWAYITLDYDETTDVVDPPQGAKAHICPSHPLALRDDRLCWSAYVDGKHSPFTDIYAGESQALMVFGYDIERTYIGIVSESMFEPWRVFLRADKVYKGRLKIVSKETAAKEWDIKINMKTTEQPLSFRPLCSSFDPSDKW